MSTVGNKDKLGVINQLHNMLTNHPERKHSTLQVKLINSENVLLAQDMFEIYTNHPMQKIKDKVEKLKFKGGIPTLNIKELVEIYEDNYYLLISI